MSDISQILQFIRDYFNEESVHLSAPDLDDNDEKSVRECIQSGFVSSVGELVGIFEDKVADYVGARHAVAVVNGTAALHLALKSCGVSQGSSVVTTSLTFAATCNAIRYCGADPIFLDVDSDTMGLSPNHLRKFLSSQRSKNGKLIDRRDRVISAVLPVHILGHPARCQELLEISQEYGIPMIEDAAEGLGSFENGRHVGTLGQVGIFSFNGNKIITTGGGGMIVTDDSELATRLKKLSTTARKDHPYEIEHDEVGYNYRMPNINAALGVSQLAKLDVLLKRRRTLASAYREFFSSSDFRFIDERDSTHANFWLHAIDVGSVRNRNEFIEKGRDVGIEFRPMWRPMHLLPMYADCERSTLNHCEMIYSHLVCLPSSPKH